MRISFGTTFMRSERRVCLMRARWERGKLGPLPGCHGYSTKLSISVCFIPRDFWVGVFWKGSAYRTEVWVTLVPMFPIRFHKVRSYGGVFP